jgi:hypothetical protein
MSSLLDLLSASGSDDAYARNQPYVRAGQHQYNTPLSPMQEMMFRGWLKQNGVPFQPEAGVTDYDMRGFYQALTQGDPRAASSINANDGMMHYPDTWKTPHHRTFSQGSQWAGEMAPRWTEDDKLVAPSGRILHDERRR